LDWLDNENDDGGSDDKDVNRNVGDDIGEYELGLPVQENDEQHLCSIDYF
jgi:hypothetical protein